MDRGLWLRILKKIAHCCELVMGRMGAVWVGARGNGLSTCPCTYIDPRVWKAKINWPYAAGTGEMGDGWNTYCRVTKPQWFLNCINRAKSKWISTRSLQSISAIKEFFLFARLHISTLWISERPKESCACWSWCRITLKSPFQAPLCCVSGVKRFMVGKDPADFYGWQMWIWLNNFYSNLPKEFPFKWRTNIGNFSLKIKNWLSAMCVRKGLGWRLEAGTDADGLIHKIHQVLIISS